MTSTCGGGGDYEPPSVSFSEGGYAEYLDLKDDVVKRLLEMVPEELKPEYCQPKELSECFLESWRKKAEVEWMRLCKGSSSVWSRFMTDRCVAVMRMVYMAVLRVNARRHFDFPHTNRQFILSLLTDSLKRLLGKKGPPSMLLSFEDHNFKKVKTDEDNAIFVLKPVFQRTLMHTPGTYEELNVCLVPFNDVSKFKKSIFETFKDQFILKIRTSFDKEHSAACVRFGGLARGVKDYLLKETLVLMKQKEIFGNNAGQWCQMFAMLLVDIVDTACDAFVRLNYQQNPGGVQVVMIRTDDGPSKDALGEFLGEEILYFFEANEIINTQPMPTTQCFLMQMLCEVNMDFVKKCFKFVPHYLSMKVKVDIKLFMIGNHKKGHMLCKLGKDVLEKIIKLYWQMLISSSKKIEFCEEAYIEECIA
jgi:hypothetical protein